MKTTVKLKNKIYTIDLSKPLDISISICGSAENVNAWYVSAPEIKPVVDGNYIGSVSKGASTNFNSIFFNPHAHGTHTECVGHITKEFHSVNQYLNNFFFMAKVITIAPGKVDNDFVISKKQIQNELIKPAPEALIIRTIPNTNNKYTNQYSHTNPPYLLEEAAIFLRDSGVKHLLIDLPSVDKEKDKGELLAHKAFWNFSGELRMDATITELIYVPNQIEDGNYFLNLQVAPFENDASPSRPVLYKILKYEG